MTDIQGFCPMGCGETLFSAEGGFITCGWLKCPRPDAVSTILADRETEHVVEIGEQDWVLQHPLKERLGDLFTCDLGEYLSNLDGPPAKPGQYRVVRQEGGGWRWEPKS